MLRQRFYNSDKVRICRILASPHNNGHTINQEEEDNLSQAINRIFIITSSVYLENYDTWAYGMSGYEKYFYQQELDFS